MDIKIAPIVLSFGIVITLFQVFNYDMVSEVDWVSAFSEGTIALTVLAGVFLVSKLRSETKVFGFLMGGFILLFIALLTDTLDEIYTSPDWVSTIFEDIFQLVGFILVVVGLFFWLRLNSQMQFDLVQLATIDPLTGCLNRRSFGEKLNYELEKCRRYNTRFAIIVMDIDHFKRINDEYGHPRGDQALQCLAENVKEVLRSTDVFSRWGGEEFIILLPESDTCKCMVVAEKIRQAVEQMSISAGNSTIQITVSIGAAVINDEGEPGEDVISRADQALYQAKNSGRNLAILADQLQSQE